MEVFYSTGSASASGSYAKLRTSLVDVAGGTIRLDYAPMHTY